MGNVIVRLGVVGISLAVLGACAGRVEPEDRSEVPREGEAALGVTATRRLPVIERPPPATCSPKGTTCDAEPWGPAGKGAATYGCGPSYEYFVHAPGTDDDFTGGIVALCPDTPAVRARFGAPVECRDCLPVAPPRSVYVYLVHYNAGPGCSHGCGYGVRASDDSRDAGE